MTDMFLREIRYAVFIFAFFCFSVPLVCAQTSTLTYQGRLTDGVTAANGTYEMQFTLHSAVSGTGNQIGSAITNNSVPVASGIFTVNLDFGTAAFSGADRWLEISVRKAADPPGFTTLSPRQPITSSPFSIKTLSATSADSLSAACAGCVTDAQIDTVSGAKVTGTVANSTNAVTAANNILKAGDTMTGQLNLPVNGLSVASNQLVLSGGKVGVGAVPVTEQLEVNGSVAIPATSDYKYKTAKTGRVIVGPEAFISANPGIYLGRVDDGFSSATVNGLGSLWATGGTFGNAAYFIAPVNLPDGAVITGFNAQLIKNGGTLQSIVELYRSDSTGYLANTAQLIASATTTNNGGGIAYVTASSVNSSFSTVDNANYRYFLRYSGEQNTQNLRFCAARITYTVTRVD